ncbi:hypothetical protein YASMINEVIRUS_49 [Yasminevirus sp. GU-2018]|uniref:Uncharacterized protein n=1 Tax=Yasminevirus sp. GU-2018 TaxID=2420051 RepID=A0A5K0U8Y3_9VIRU|nr:hypothetical protein YASMINEVIRUS_49 [Yasminevirus sp. GU-2018]
MGSTQILRRLSNLSPNLSIFPTVFVLALVLTGDASKNVILSSGLGGWDASKLQHQYNAFSAYANMGIVSATSILAYNLDVNGYLDTYNTSDPNMTAEQYQYLLGSLQVNPLGNQMPKNVSTLPCLYCDATIGNCQNLGERLRRLFLHQQQFIDSTIQKIKQFNWDGYIVDFEPDQSVNPDRLTDFVIDWGCQLKALSRKLYVWTGFTAPYNMSVLTNSSCVNILTMNTYVGTYDSFIQIGSDAMLETPDTNRLGFGLLTSDFVKKSYINNDHFKSNTEIVLNEHDFEQVIEWIKTTNTESISIWASIIPPNWYSGLRNYWL